MDNPKRDEAVPTSLSKAALSFGLFGIILVVLLILFVLFTYNYGAARLAYCAFNRLGYGEGGALIISIIAWFFSGIYYPMHALFITTECSSPTQVLTGGRRFRKN